MFPYLDVGTLHDSLLAVHALDEAVSEPGRGVGHGEGGAAGAVLGLHHLSAGVLDPLSQGLEINILSILLLLSLSLALMSGAVMTLHNE